MFADEGWTVASLQKSLKNSGLSVLPGLHPQQAQIQRGVLTDLSH